MTPQQKRASLWQTIRALRQQKKAAKTDEARAKIRAAYRKAVAELEAARQSLGGGKKKVAVAPAKKGGKKMAKAA